MKVTIDEANAMAELERRAMQEDPNFKRAVLIWKQRAITSATIRQLQVELAKEFARLTKDSEDLARLRHKVKAEFHDAVFW